MSKTWSLFLCSIPWSPLLPILSTNLTWLKCAQSHPAWHTPHCSRGRASHLPTLPDKAEPPPMGRREAAGGGGRCKGVGGNGTDPALSLSSWQGTWGLLSEDQDPLLGVWQMKASTILSHPTVAWARRRGQAGRPPQRS